MLERMIAGKRKSDGNEAFWEEDCREEDCGKEDCRNEECRKRIAGKDFYWEGDMLWKGMLEERLN